MAVKAQPALAGDDIKDQLTIWAEPAGDSGKMLFANGNGDWWRILGPVAGASVTGLVTFIIWWLSKKRPNKIQVREVEIITLLRVAETILPRIAATLDGRRIRALSQIEFAITNIGSETIKPVVLEFDFPESTKVLECELTGVVGAMQQPTEGTNTLAIAVPFLNPFRHHRDCLTAKVVCDGEARIVKLGGRGEGWSVKHSTAESIERRSLIFFTVIFVGTGAASLAWGFSIPYIFGIPKDEISMRSLLAATPSVLLLLTVSFVFLRLLTRRMTRRGR